MFKLLCILNRRQHYKNRIKLRKGKTIWFLFSKVIDERNVLDSSKGKCLVWKFKNHVYITQNNQLQTYIKTKL